MLAAELAVEVTGQGGVKDHLLSEVSAVFLNFQIMKRREILIFKEI